jgi:hypothetical protein
MIALKLRIACPSPNPSESRERCIGIVALEGLKGQSILVIASFPFSIAVSAFVGARSRARWETLTSPSRDCGPRANFASGGANSAFEDITLL